MKQRLALIFLAWIAQLCQGQVASTSDTTYNEKVKTVLLCRESIDGEAPILNMGSDDHLTLSFDILGDEPQALRYGIKHCDAEWNMDQLEPYEYYSGFEENNIGNYASSFTTLQPYIHYFQNFPSEYEKFIVSGNYIVYVYPYDHPDSLLLVRRFRVNENLLTVSKSVSRATSGGSISSDQEVSVSIDGIRADAPSGSESLLRPEYLRVYLQQNGRLDNQRQLKFSGYENRHLCYRWNDANRFAGGNTFRFFDLSNLRAPIYNIQRIERYGGETFAVLKPEEDRSHKALASDAVLNGGMKINVWDRDESATEADYAWVIFSLPMSKPMLGGSIHVVGELTQWRLDEKSRMEWSNSNKAYTMRLYLKQGYYAYQLLYLPAGDKEGLTSTLEGDHSETANDYHVYIYYSFPGERYDRLIGVR